MTIKRIATVVLVLFVAALGFAPAVVAAVVSAAAGAGLLSIAGETTTTNDLNAAMKILFEDTIVNNVVTDSELLDLFEEGDGIKTDQTTGGRFIETSQLFALPAGVGSRNEGGYIPVPFGPNIQNSRVNLKKVMGSVEMTGEVLKRVKTDRGAFIDWGKQVMPKLVERLTNELDRMLIGYGAGIKAQVANIAGNVVTVNNALGVAGYADAWLQFLENERLRASVLPDFVAPKPGVYAVRAVDPVADAITVDDPAGLAIGDFLAEGDGADHSGGKDPMGLIGCVDDGLILPVFQNIARAGFRAWQGTVIDAQAAPFAPGQTLTEDVLAYADDTTFTRGGGQIDAIVTSRRGLRQLWRDMRQDRSFNDPRSYTGGKGRIFIVLGDRQVQIRVARKLPSQLCFGLTRKTFKKWMLHAFEWDTTTGSLFRQVTDNTGRRDAFYAYGTMYLEIGNSDPQKNFRIENLPLV